jgi:hypothetical protein
VEANGPNSDGDVHRDGSGRRRAASVWQSVCRRPLDRSRVVIPDRDEAAGHDAV